MLNALKSAVKISNTVDVGFRIRVKPTMTLQIIRTVLGKTDRELPDNSIRPVFEFMLHSDWLKGPPREH